MFVTIQLKNPSQQDRLSQARQMDAGGLVLSSLPGTGQRSRTPEARGAVSSEAGRAGEELRVGLPGPVLGHFRPSIPHVWRTRTL